MRYMLDTNICIYAIHNRPSSVLEHIRQLNPGDICISAITYAELMHGVEKSTYKERNFLALMAFLAQIDILDFDVKAANEFGNIRADLERKGTPIGMADYMIAGHARSLGYTLITNNMREFERVENLNLENWAIS